MGSVIGILLDMQDQDLRIFNLRKQITSVPREKERVRIELQASRNGFDAAKQQVVDAEKAIKKIELDIDGCNHKIRDLQNKSLEVKKNDEYRSLMAEVKRQKDRISDLETQQLERMEELDAARDALAHEQKQLDAAQARIEATVKDLDVREANCRTQIGKVQEARDGMAGRLPPELLRLYSRLAGRSVPGRNFVRAVVPVQSDTCGGCFLKMTPHARNQARKEEWGTCENCGAILYYE